MGARKNKTSLTGVQECDHEPPFCIFLALPNAIDLTLPDSFRNGEKNACS